MSTDNGPAIGRRGVLVGAALAPALRLRRAAAGEPVRLRLPAPTGPFPVGLTTWYLVDDSRPDPWDPTIPVRELMVTVFYPSTPDSHRPRVRQMTAAAAASFAQLTPLFHPQLPASGVDWSATRTHSRWGPPARAGRFPVVLYSPGGGDPRTLGTSTAEDLASHGRVVVTIDHPGDASEVDFPAATAYRPKLRNTVLRGDPRSDPALFRTLIDTRVRDIGFVHWAISALAAGVNPDRTGRPLPPGLSRAVDPDRICGYGHSAGGTAMTLAFAGDPTIRAVADLEGYLDDADGRLYPIARDGTDRPVLLLGTDGFRTADIVRPWSALRRHSPRCRWEQLRGTMHWALTDYAALVPQLQAAGLMTPAGRAAMVGPAPASYSIPAVRTAVGRFFG